MAREENGHQRRYREQTLGRMEQLAIVRELTAQKRNRLFSYAAYVEILNRGTEPPAR